MRRRLSRKVFLRLVLLCGMIAGPVLFLWFGLREPASEEIVRAAVRDVNREESWGQRFHWAVWRRLPQMVTEMLPESGPTDIKRVRIEAIEQLGHLAPQSHVVVTTLLGVSGDQSRSLEEHLAAIAALGKIGPFAKDAIDPFLGIIGASTNITNPFATERQRACFWALGTIAPTDERVLNAVFAQIVGNWFDGAAFLESNAPLYGAEVQGRLVELMRSDQRLKRILIRVAGKINQIVRKQSRFSLGDCETRTMGHERLL